MIVLVDFGSTFTKLRAVTVDGTLAARVQHRTTVEGDVLDGLENALSLLEQEVPSARAEPILACSSAGGGLRMAVVGLVEDLTTEAARLAALGAGARVLSVHSGGLADIEAARALAQQQPDLIMLVGGTDGGDAATLIESSRLLAEARPTVPVVLAGNSAAQPEAAAILEAAGVTAVRTENVLPEFDRIAPEPARKVLRELFISHVIGGKLGSGTRLEELVTMATPDAALEGVKVLAEALGTNGDAVGVIAVDVGGATTDVHSYAPRAPRPGYKHSLLPQPPAMRTVEADIGMRWNAPRIVEAACEQGLITAGEAHTLAPAAERRAADPGFLPADAEELDTDRRLARLAIAIALRRHAGRRRVALRPEGAVLERLGRDVCETEILIGTGGVCSGMGPEELISSLELACSGSEQRLLPRTPRVAIDHRGTIVAAGLLAGHDRALAMRLMRREAQDHLWNTEEEKDVIAIP